MEGGQPFWTGQIESGVSWLIHLQLVEFELQEGVFISVANFNTIERLCVF